MRNDSTGISMTPIEREQAARSLREAYDSGNLIAPLRERYPSMTAEDAYAVQSINTQQRCELGRRIVGRKIGLTSAAVQQQLGVGQPDFGMLFDDMSYGDSEPISFAGLHQPKVEAEIAFVLRDDLAMTHPGHAEVMRAVDYLVPAIEVVGSRIASWNIKFVDTVADNASAGVYVLGGTPVKITDVDLRLCGMVLEKRGDPVSTGAGAACLGHPLNAVVWLARTMAALDSPLRAGDIVLSGALGPMASVEPGDCFCARINGLGSVRALFDPLGAGAGA